MFNKNDQTMIIIEGLRFTAAPGVRSKNKIFTN